MGVPTEEFLRKLQEFDKLIRYAAWRYRIPGVLDKEDLYQEGLVILDMMFRKYNFSPDSEDFRKLFKTELWHGLHKVLQRHKQSKRDWRKVVNNDFSYNDLAAAEEESESSGESSLRTASHSPEENVCAQEDESEVAAFVDALNARLDDEASVVLYELLHPRSWDDIPEKYHLTQTELTYERYPKAAIPRHVIADLLGMPKIRLKRAVKRIRRAAAEVAEDLGMPQLIAAGLKFRAGKKKKNVEREESEGLPGSTVLQSGADSDCDESGASDLEVGVEDVLAAEG